MVLDILPSDVDRAKDLAVWHQALVLPQLIATPIGEGKSPTPTRRDESARRGKLKMTKEDI